MFDRTSPTPGPEFFRPPQLPAPEMVDATPKGDAHGHRFSHSAMGGEFEVIIYDQSDDYAGQAAEAAFDEIDRIETELSRFLPDSDISQINSSKPGEWVRVGAAALECLTIAKNLFYWSNRVFDVTVGDLVDAFKAEDAPVLSDESNQSTRPGMDWVEISEAYHAVALRGSGLQVDLGGIGKGYALDCVAQLLAEWSIESALLHAGHSTLLPIGSPPNGTVWSVGLRDPEHLDTHIGTVQLSGVALSGSGIQVKGRHIINPVTGVPAETKLGTWAVAESAALSDALSTTLMILSPDEIESLLAKDTDNQFGGMIMLAGDDGESRELREFGGWSRFQAMPMDQ